MNTIFKTKPQKHLLIQLIKSTIVCMLLSTISIVSNAYAFKNNLPTIAIVTTGGTVAEKIDPKTKKAVPAVSGDDLIEAIPALKKIANIKVVEFSDIDSSQMTPAIWLRLSKVVNRILKDPKITGVVVTHGTDTMAEGAYFLDLTTSTSKPIVFTGAMRSASNPYPDGPPNILNAVTQAASKQARNWGVTISLNQYINSAASVRKIQTTNVQAFDSGEKGYLGYIQSKHILRFHDRIHRLYFPLPKKLPRVDLITTFAGDDGNIIRYSVNSGAKGIVVEAVGAGNVNADVFKAIKYAISKNVVVIITSRVANGRVYPIYGDQGGGATLAKNGAILDGDLDAAKTRILLMLALPTVGKNHNKLKQYFKLPTQ
ncbi:MAG: asparaginase [Gammaproteobacteria bacterium]|jgi:L-asparaginase